MYGNHAVLTQLGFLKSLISCSLNCLIFGPFDFSWPILEFDSCWLIEVELESMCLLLEGMCYYLNLYLVGCNNTSLVCPVSYIFYVSLEFSWPCDLRYEIHSLWKFKHIPKILVNFQRSHIYFWSTHAVPEEIVFFFLSFLFSPLFFFLPFFYISLSPSLSPLSPLIPFLPPFLPFSNHRWAQ